jgi:hypothetical protein
MGFRVRRKWDHPPEWKPVIGGGFEAAFSVGHSLPADMKIVKQFFSF